MPPYRRAHLALFPEAFVSAYPRGLGFGAVVGSRTTEGREQFRRYWESAIEVPGPHVERMAGLARANRLHLVVGVVERSGGTLYCTAVFLGADGRYLGRHRKVMPTASERLVWGFGDGSTLTVVDTELGRIGAVICWENYMPLLRAAMYAKGVEIYCAPTADARADLDAEHAAHRAGGPLLRAVGQPVRAAQATTRSTTRPSSATIRRRSSRAAAAASSARSARCSRARTSAARPS